jgi:hypothetical protein
MYIVYGRDSPGIWLHVPVVSRIASLSRNPARLHKWGCTWHKHKLSILSTFIPYISIFSGCGSSRSLQSGRGRPKVGVARNFLCAKCAHYILCPGLGNYACSFFKATVELCHVAELPDRGITNWFLISVN